MKKIKLKKEERKEKRKWKKGGGKEGKEKREIEKNKSDRKKKELCQRSNPCLFYLNSGVVVHRIVPWSTDTKG